VRFDYVTTPFLTQSTSRMAPVGGGWAIVEALGERAEKAGVEFFYETTARSLIQDARGAVVGLRAVGRDNALREFGARGVVLASGGFQGNHEMLAQYFGRQALAMRPIARGGYYNKGEGIRMALAIGAAPRGDFGEFHAEPIDPRSGAPEPANFIFCYGILVNSAGQRFTDEARGPIDAHYEAVTRLINLQAGGIAYSIFDAGLDEVPNWRTGMRSDEPPIEAATIGALAEGIGVPAAALERTVAEYNRACGDGAFKPLAPDGLATRELDPPKSNWARRIDRPPYRCWPVTAANTFTFGGLAVDSDARVINMDGEPIPGLYAAGETVGLYYKTYVGSTSVLKGAVFGRKAALHDAARNGASK
ncbi:MAG: FAD-binding protein, partial [Burkholderiales bacterium]